MEWSVLQKNGDKKKDKRGSGLTLLQFIISMFIQERVQSRKGCRGQRGKGKQFKIKDLSPFWLESWSPDPVQKGEKKMIKNIFAPICCLRATMKCVARTLLNTLLAFSIVVAGLGLAGCWLQPAFDVSQYFGKSEKEIIEMLGEPSQRETLHPGPGSFCFHYVEESKIPQPLFRAFKICFSDKGLSYHFWGQTRGYDTPD